MNALLWLLIPVAATLLAIAWAVLRSRPTRPISTAESMQELRRLHEAMQRPLPDADRPTP